MASDVVCWFLCAFLIRMTTDKNVLQPAAQFAVTAVLFDYVTRVSHRDFLFTYVLFFAGHLFVDVSVNYVKRILKYIRENGENGENEEKHSSESEESDEEPEDYVVRKRSPSPRVVRRKSRRLEQMHL